MPNWCEITLSAYIRGLLILSSFSFLLQVQPSTSNASCKTSFTKLAVFFSTGTSRQRVYCSSFIFFHEPKKKFTAKKKKLLNISSVIDKISRKKTILHRTLVTISCTYFLLHDLKKGFSADVIFFFTE